VRIISGQLRGRKLKTVPGMSTRPTSDRVRESLFNILDAKPRGARVLDLFAGTGALGIEAISRGAESALFVESAPRALSILKANLQSFGLEQQSRVLRWNITKNLNCLKPYTHTFDLVFMDPPYSRQLIMPTLAHLRKSEALCAGALIVIEHAPGEVFEETSLGMRRVDERRYGSTQLTFLHHAASEVPGLEIA
jgi:16S rRNA (guanine966-N2)-methyltransferase